ncbi:hypothetical protein CYCD_30040 [Tenuifilaceae bacterium CYCD]|nr:hypothetical protein CYCD_30040 [Tenuifilaceae bacterium CYCD]
MKIIELKEEEMNYLVGGHCLLSLAVDDINNHNQVDGCTCTYNNHSVINNNNDIAGCRCKCI